MIQLDEPAPRLGTYGIELVFKDETNSLMTPDSVQWTLTDRDGDVINDREDIVIDEGDLASTMVIVLSGNDLADHPSGEGRILFVESTFTSSLGSGLPLPEWIHFTVGQ